MRHVVVGGNGFLGRELVRQLAGKPAQVLSIDLQPTVATEFHESKGVCYQRADISKIEELNRIDFTKWDVVHHLASRLIVPNYPRQNRAEYFRLPAVTGTQNLVQLLMRVGISGMIFWSSDMVYGPAITSPRNEDHPRVPLGPYGAAKKEAEDFLIATRAKGFKATIFRPRLIIGPGRLGIFRPLFGLIKNGWPIPVIGSGKNRFQFVSVSDCARASVAAAERHIPNAEVNLGSAMPPTVVELLNSLVRSANSRSKVIRVPSSIVKPALRLLNLFSISPMDPEQFEIADQEVTLDIDRAAKILDWRPADSDCEMLSAAYHSYRLQSR